MKRKLISLLSVSILAMAINPTFAASQDECAIWLCAPAGFPGSECSAAHSIFIHRLKKGKNPFPNFSSCTESADGSTVADDEFEVKQGIAAYIPEHEETRCLEYRRSYNVIPPHDVCVDQETYTVPAQYLEGRYCVHGAQGGTEPKGCRGTYNFVKVFDRDKNQIGETYYFTY